MKYGRGGDGLGRGERILYSMLCAALGAALYYTDSWEMLPALALAAAAHELSHLAAMLLLGCRPTAFRLEPSGFCIEYRSGADCFSDCLIALAGPAGGALAAWGAHALSRLPAGDLPELCASLCLLLSAFNLLPIPPLDGGRVFEALSIRALGPEQGRRLSSRVGLIFTLLLLAAGACCAALGRGCAPLLAALWLLCLRNEERPLAKEEEMG